MFFQTTVIAALTALAAATPLAIRTGGESCNSGPVQCCNSVQDASSVDKGLFAAIAAVDIGKITGIVGLQCSPVASLLPGTSCATQTVCCENTKFNGLINVGCTPINVAL